MDTMQAQRQRDPEVAKKPAYISYCRICGGMTGACDPERTDAASEFAREVIAAGQILQRETAAEVWAGKWCICHDGTPWPQEVEQASLFDGSSTD